MGEALLECLRRSSILRDRLASRRRIAGLRLQLQDGGEVSSEDVLAATMDARANTKGVTFVAFTATPKAKTME